MSRKIKFRGWIDKPGRWEGDYCANKMYYDIQNSYDTLGDVKPEDIMQSFDEWFIDDNCIVEQYTGLKDKNGREIYEGDIVFFFTEHFDKATGGFDGEDEHNATVEWFDNGFAFIDKAPYDPNIECEVIGNIHENPELLEN